jgi:hypothetical protein
MRFLSNVVSLTYLLVQDTVYMLIFMHCYEQLYFVRPLPLEDLRLGCS